MPHADINGQKIYFEDTGGDGEVVILAHGFLVDHEMFVHQVAALRRAYRVITWDERGFGLTEYDGEPFPIGIRHVTASGCSITSGSTERSSVA